MGGKEYNGVVHFLNIVFGCYPPFGIVYMWDKIYLIRKISLGETDTHKELL